MKNSIIQPGKIRFYRNRNGFTQEFVANQLGICQSTYQRIETDEVNISIDRLMQIANILEEPLAAFLKDEYKHLDNQSNANNHNANGLASNFSAKEVELMQKMLTQQEAHIIEQKAYIIEQQAKIQRKDKKIEDLIKQKN
jgi:transcriptional regulator with XRE-family HTH domain